MPGLENIDLNSKEWHVYDDNYGTDQEKLFVKFLNDQADRLYQIYEEFYLVRNERAVKLFSFTHGQGFEPDYLLFLRKMGESASTRWRASFRAISAMREGNSTRFRAGCSGARRSRTARRCCRSSSRTPAGWPRARPGSTRGAGGAGVRGRGPAPVHPAPPDHAGGRRCRSCGGAGRGGDAMGRFPALRACSFDRGFHSPANQAELGAPAALSALAANPERLGRLLRDKERKRLARRAPARRLASPNPFQSDDPAAGGARLGGFRPQSSYAAFFVAFGCPPTHSDPRRRHGRRALCSPAPADT